jgi:hypothetical protein
MYVWIEFPKIPSVANDLSSKRGVDGEEGVEYVGHRYQAVPMAGAEPRDS